MDQIVNDWIKLLCEASNNHRKAIDELKAEVEDLRAEISSLRKGIKKNGKKRKKKDCARCDKAGDCLK